MGLDVGRKRIGVALSDELLLFATPHTSIELGSKRGQSIRDILLLCKEKKVGEIVIGYPLKLSGEPGEQAEFTMKFKIALEKQIQEDQTLNDKPYVVLWDERFTSVEAERGLAHSGKKDLDRRKAKDQASASIILESYLLSRTKKG